MPRSCTRVEAVKCRLRTLKAIEDDRGIGPGAFLETALAPDGSNYPRHMLTRYEWLPDRHLSLAATLAHADELIEQIGDLLLAYEQQAGGVIGIEARSRGLLTQGIVTTIAPIPRKVPLLVADALNTLRSALEHALFTEVEELEGQPLSTKAAKVVELPASRTYEDFTEWIKRRARNGPKALAAGTEVTRRIEQLQPFHMTLDSTAHPLARLTAYTNHAKHRTPAVTALRLGAIYRDQDSPRSASEIEERSEQPLLIGDIIAEVPFGHQEQYTIFPTIGIHLPDTDRWPILLRELGEIADWTRLQALPRLISGTDSVEPPLPARYEISVGARSEREALALGVSESAVLANKRRRKALTARHDLPGLLSPLDNAPSHEELSEWVWQLSDKEVLDLWTPWITTNTESFEVVRHNYSVLCAMRDKANAYIRKARDLRR